MPRKNILFLINCVFAVILSVLNLTWIFQRWFANSVGLVGLSVLIIGSLFLFKSRKNFIPNNQLAIEIELLVITLFGSNFLTNYNILKAIAFFWLLILLFRFWFNLNLSKLYHLLFWAFLSLPVIPLLGSTLGLLNRIFYTNLISFFFKNAKVLGTSLIDQNYIFSIDSGCSGVLGLYLLSCFWIIYSFQTEKINFKSLFLGLGFFWILNTLRVFLLYIIQNILHYPDISHWDFGLGLFVFVSSIIFMYIKLQKHITKNIS